MAIGKINLNVNGLNTPTKDTDWLNGYKNETHIYIYMLSTRDPLQTQRHIQTESERMEKDIPPNGMEIKRKPEQQFSYQTKQT